MLPWEVVPHMPLQVLHVLYVLSWLGNLARARCGTKRFIFLKKLFSTTQHRSLLSATNATLRSIGLHVPRSELAVQHSSRKQIWRCKTKGTVMWLKASDIFKEALFHNTAPRFNIDKHSKSRIGTERGKKQQEIKRTQDYQQGHCDVN